MEVSSHPRVRVGKGTFPLLATLHLVKDSGRAISGSMPWVLPQQHEIPTVYLCENPLLFL